MQHFVINNILNSDDHNVVALTPRPLDEAFEAVSSYVRGNIEVGSDYINASHIVFVSDVTNQPALEILCINFFVVKIQISTFFILKRKSSASLLIHILLTVR